MLSMIASRFSSRSSLLVTKQQSLYVWRRSMAVPFSTMGDDKTKPTIVSKKDIVSEIAETHELTKKKAEQIFDSILDIIVDKVSENQKVRLHNFGTFETILTKERNGVNPGTREPLRIPAKHRIRFRPSPGFKKSANGEVKGL